MEVEYTNDQIHEKWLISREMRRKGGVNFAGPCARTSKLHTYDLFDNNNC